MYRGNLRGWGKKFVSWSSIRNTLKIQKYTSDRPRSLAATWRYDLLWQKRNIQPLTRWQHFVSRSRREENVLQSALTRQRFPYLPLDMYSYIYSQRDPRGRFCSHNDHMKGIQSDLASPAGTDEKYSLGLGCCTQILINCSTAQALRL